ncbi:hypothetical protein ES708_22739 [subsurface metagenome]
MIAYKKEKRENAMCYFATEHFNRTTRNVPQTTLYKYLAYLDFTSLKEIGKPALELEYKAMSEGPVPPEIYNRRKNYKSRLVEFIPTGENKYIVRPKGNADLDYFSKHEIRKMNELINKYAIRSMSEKEIIDRICDDSHKEIRAWKVAHDIKENTIMRYEDTFENIFDKTEKELTAAEENFLLYLH